MGRQLLIRPLIPRFSQDRAPAVLLWVKSSKPTKKKKLKPRQNTGVADLTEKTEKATDGISRKKHETAG